ncbi:MAG: hypothetical protein HN742_17860 [Lentisphaerae bacterium]|nr:hypothetical protein [Lentisphaerota bacterium]MBT4815034.1 hypothetical protein [Lentisphaerota bacterium]MBT5613021.1 hypothetical protein [Lentisphaerota bacterium]MBT7056733.1 hypothetical protein [Lentisphaerota bacterium]MBT7843749.1 hypothetical protein [Lentisphaerota bacterium]
MAESKRTAEQVIREIEDLTNLCLRLARAGADAGLHQRDPLQPTPPNPDEVYYDPADVALARRYRAEP